MASGSILFISQLSCMDVWDEWMMGLEIKPRFVFAEECISGWPIKVFYPLVVARSSIQLKNTPI